MGDRRIEHDIFGTEPRAKTINQKQKGNTNERVAAKFLSEWTGAQFNRTPSSGGMHLKNQLFCGDIVCVTEEFFFPFVVETKHLKSLHLTEKLRTNSAFFTIFKQAQRDADRIGKRPLCLLRGNGMKAGEYYLVLPYILGLKLERSGSRLLGPPKADRLALGFNMSITESILIYSASAIREKFTWRQFTKSLGFTGSKPPKKA